MRPKPKRKRRRRPKRPRRRKRPRRPRTPRVGWSSVLAMATFGRGTKKIMRGGCLQGGENRPKAKDAKEAKAKEAKAKAKAGKGHVRFRIGAWTQMCGCSFCTPFVLNSFNPKKAHTNARRSLKCMGSRIEELHIIVTSKAQRQCTTVL